jgi:preprotein translocase subunit SecE
MKLLKKTDKNIKKQNNIKKKKQPIIIRRFKKLWKEFKLIHWCSPKECFLSGMVVILVGGCMALILTGFNIISAYIVTWIGGLV